MSRGLKCPLCKSAIHIDPESYGDDMACPECHGTIKAIVSIDKQVLVLPSTDPTALSNRKFIFYCGRCNSALEARGRQCGSPGQCPTCGAGFIVPDQPGAGGHVAGTASVEDDGQLPTPMHAYATAGANAPRIRTLPNGEQIISCPRCSASNDVDADLCKGCGLPFTMEGAQSVAMPGPSPNTLATASLTVGVIAAVTFCGPAAVLGPIAVGLGIGGYLRADQMEGPKSGRGMAIAGIILGLFGLLAFGAQIAGWP